MKAAHTPNEEILRRKMGEAPKAPERPINAQPVRKPLPLRERLR